MIESEIEISEDLVRDLLREQHPDLAELPIREVAGGWGNVAVRRLRKDLPGLRALRSSMTGQETGARTLSSEEPAEGLVERGHGCSGRLLRERGTLMSFDPAQTWKADLVQGNQVGEQSVVGLSEPG